MKHVKLYENLELPNLDENQYWVYLNKNYSAGIVTTLLKFINNTLYDDGYVYVFGAINNTLYKSYSGKKNDIGKKEDDFIIGLAGLTYHQNNNTLRLANEEEIYLYDLFDNMNNYNL
jgi:hypothetical protein